MPVMAKKTLRICEHGHRYYKSSDCPTCPICALESKPSEGFLSIVNAPARRALQGAGITTLAQLAKTTEASLLALHGIGPASIPTLRKALEKEGLAFLDKKRY
jgi:predicted RecB family nuclease